MNSYLNRREAVNAALQRLERYQTLSPFSRLFYRYLSELLTEAGAEETRLAQAFHVFLRVECRRHESATRLVNTGRIEPQKIIQLGRESNFLMDQLRCVLESIELADPQQALFRDLLLAECAYHLGRTEEVVAWLRRAIVRGSHHPLVHFALGYNMYASALQRFTEPGPHKGEVVARNPRALNVAFADAIRAFEEGLGDEAFDAQLYWWIGMIREMSGDKDGACEAYRSAMNVDPDHFGDQATDKLRKLESGVQRSPREARRLAKLGPITDEDLILARLALDQSDIFHTYFPDPER